MDDLVEILECVTTRLCREHGVEVVVTRPEVPMFGVPGWVWAVMRGAPAETWCGQPSAGAPTLLAVLGNPERQAATAAAYALGGDRAVASLVDAWTRSAR